MHPFVATTAAAAVAAVLLVTYICTRRSGSRLPYPPGPKPEWILGNARQMPAKAQWLTFAKWGEQYGGYVFARVFGAPFLIVNSAKVAFDLLDKRSTIYSDRTESVMANELIGWDFNMTFVGYTDRWRAHRKIMHQSLHPRAVEQYQPMVLREAHMFIQRVTKSPDNFLSEIKRLAGSVIMTMAYGYEVKKDDPYIDMVEEAVYGLTQTLGVGFAVDMLPILKHVPEWMPGAGFKKLAKQWRISTRGILELPWKAMMEKYSAGTALPSYCANLLDLIGGADCDEDATLAVKETAGVIYAAGNDSTLALIMSFFLAMARHPEVFRRAQEEVDSVVGRDRLPTFEEREQLPYLECVLREVYRWNPAAPLGVAHRLTQDDVYEGHHIPAGTAVIPNIWAMLHDPAIYPSPLDFDPARYERMSPAEFKAADPRNFMFGFGRRACVGRHFADGVVWCVLATVLATVDIGRKLDAEGQEIVPEAVYPHFVGHPAPFECAIRIRSPDAGRMVDEAVLEEARLVEGYEMATASS